MTQKKQSRPKTTTPTPVRKKVTQDLLIKQLLDGFIALRLPEMASSLKQMMATKNSAQMTPILETLWELVEPQICRRRERAIDYRIRRAKFPAYKSLDNFDFAFQPKLDRNRVMHLAVLDFIRKGENVLIGGMSGTGKSHIAIALGYLACAEGFNTIYTTSADMLTQLHAGLMTGTLFESLRKYLRCDVLIVDEVGLDRPEQESTRDAQLFYKVIAPRYQSPKSTIITSNIEWSEWGTALGDDIAAVAILDRLVHHGHLITIEGPSYRAREHEALNAQQSSSNRNAGQTAKIPTSTKQKKKIKHPVQQKGDV